MEQELFPVLIVRADPERPGHVHTCLTKREHPETHLEYDVGHQWECKSPYCSKLIRVCTTHGGEKPRED